MNEDYDKAIAKTRAYILGIGILFALGIALSLVRSIDRIREERRNLAVSQAGIISRTIFTARRWTMGNDTPSLLAAQTSLQFDLSNKGSNRSTQETGGDKNSQFAKFDHISMMQFMEELLSRVGLHAHFVSQEPLYIAEFPDSNWERVSFEKIVKGSKKEYTVTGTAGDQVFRYMEPLRVDAGCIHCHAQQGYKIGDAHDAISISFPYSPFVQSARREERHEIISHLLILMAALVILFFFGRKVVGLTKSLQETQRKVRSLEGILPMCTNCKKVRRDGAEATDQISWVSVDSYIVEHSEAQVSHGICPECMEKLYGPGGSLTDI